MDFSGFPELFRRRLEEIEQMAPLERVRLFLQSHVDDSESLDEIRLDLRHIAAHTTFKLALDLRDLDALLAQPQEPGLLARIVTFDCNRVLDDPSDNAAADFLRPIADLLREVITEAEQRRSQPR